MTTSVGDPATSRDAQARAFLHRLVELTQQELAYEASATELLLSQCAPRVLERHGLALAGLVVHSLSAGMGARTLVEIGRDPALANSSHEAGDKLLLPSGHTFRPGDLAAIVDNRGGGPDKKKKAAAAGKTKEGKGIQGVVARVMRDRLVIAIDHRDDAQDDDSIDWPERLSVLKLANASTFNRQISTLEHVLKDYVGQDDAQPPKKQSELVSLLLGFASLPKNYGEARSSTRSFYDGSLNGSQRRALEHALAEETRLALVWGPPGTGKTSTLVECVRQLVINDKKRVLVCGASNLAVDNLLARLSKLSSAANATKDREEEKDEAFRIPERPLRLTRLGHPARVMPELVQKTLDVQSQSTNAAEVLSDVRTELDALLRDLQKGKVKGKARGEAWKEVRNLRKEWRKREGGVVRDVVQNAEVVLCTCHGAGGRQLANERFDVVIIDEAAQAVEPACWIPILKADKLILAGDHLQLPPTIKSLNDKSKSKSKTSASFKAKPTDKADGASDASNGVDSASDATDKVSSGLKTSKEASKPESTPKSLKPPATLEQTLFERVLALHGNKVRTMLEVQYRMHEKIMAFPSKTLYDGRLVADESVKTRTVADLIGSDDEDLREPVIFFDTAGQAMYERASGDDEGASALTSESKSNENEATLVCKHIDALVNAGVAQASIAVVSPYNAQVSLISRALEDTYPDVEVGSVDGFQGREFDVVAVSLVRSNDSREVGFLSEKRRLNVAMTRPRRQLVVVGNSETVSKGSGYLKAWTDWLEENATVLTPDQVV